MTVDPERLKVAMDAVQKLAIRYFNRSWLTSIEKSIVLEVITAINAHDRPSKVPGDEVDAVDAALDGWFGPGWTSDATAGWLGPLRERMSRALAFAAGTRSRTEPDAVARLAEIGQSAWEWVGGQDGSIDGGALLRRIHDLATRPLAAAPDPPPDTVPFTREMAELIDRIAANVVYLLDMNDASEDSLLIESRRLDLFPPNPKDNRDAP